MPREAESWESSASSSAGPPARSRRRPRPATTAAEMAMILRRRLRLASICGLPGAPALLLGPRQLSGALVRGRHRAPPITTDCVRDCRRAVVRSRSDAAPACACSGRGQRRPGTAAAGYPRTVHRVTSGTCEVSRAGRRIPGGRVRDELLPRRARPPAASAWSSTRAWTRCDGIAELVARAPAASRPPSCSPTATSTTPGRCSRSASGYGIPGYIHPDDTVMLQRPACPASPGRWRWRCGR